MIIISESIDSSTNKILEWLFFYNANVKRINYDKDFFNFSIQITENKITHNFENNILYNRRGYLPIIPKGLEKSIWYNYLKKEQLVPLFSLELINNNSIGSYKNEFNNNKLFNLFLAKKARLNIPKTIVTNNKIDLLRFVKKDKKYITKSLQNPPNTETKDFYYYSSGTFEINIDDTSDFFCASMVQEYVEKEIEIRIFFIENVFFSMAIFSQNDEKTKIDYRKFNTEKPNRCVPFNLPNSILKKIKLFIGFSNYNTGSIDLILTPKGKYVFLEINPMGQYDWLSQSCNYYIDKKIAELIIKKSNNGRNKKDTTVRI